jgi:hypothetical protein
MSGPQGGSELEGSLERAPRPLVWLLCLYVASLPLFSISLLNLGGRGLGRLDWMLGAALVGVLVFMLPLRSIRLTGTSVDKLALLLLCSGLVSGVGLMGGTGAQVEDFATKAPQLVMVVAVFWAISRLPLSEAQIKWVVRVWFLTSLAVALYGLYQIPARTYGWPGAYVQLSNPSTAPRGIQTARSFGLEGGEIWGTMEGVGFVQVSSILREPTWMGSYLLSGVIFFGVLVFSDRGNAALLKSPMLNRLVWAVLLLGLVVTLALAPLLAFAATLGVAWFVGGWLRRWSTRIVLILIVGLLLANVVLGAVGIGLWPALMTRVEGLWMAVTASDRRSGSVSLDARLTRASAALEAWERRPLFGLGLNGVAHNATVAYSNSGWVTLLAEQGVVGLAIMLALLWTLLRGLARLLRGVPPSSWTYCLAAALIIVIISDAIGTLTTHSWTHPLRWLPLSLGNLILVRSRS